MMDVSGEFPSRELRRIDQRGELNIGRTIQVLNSLLPQYKRRTPTPKLEGDLLQEKVEFGKGKSENYCT